MQPLKKISIFGAKFIIFENYNLTQTILLSHLKYILKMKEQKNIL